jgi:hypothetical protein
MDRSSGGVMTRGGLKLLEGVAEQQQAQATEERRTHAALTFEQPIPRR